MGKIFIGQTKLDITLLTNTVLTGVTTALIKYKKPDLTPGSWTATVVGGLDAAHGKITYEVQAGDIDQAGKWVFWAHITYSDGKIIEGECDSVTIYTAGDC